MQIQAIPEPRALQQVKEKRRVIRNIRKLQKLSYTLDEIAHLTDCKYTEIRLFSSAWIKTSYSLEKAKELNRRFEQIFSYFNNKK